MGKASLNPKICEYVGLTPLLTPLSQIPDGQKKDSGLQEVV
jgi:hypothetical protein